jgi:hypothetical protein
MGINRSRKMKILRIFGFFFVLYLIILIAWVAYHSRKVYVLDLGGKTQEMPCRVFDFRPTENTVYCDGESYLGVRGVDVR